MSNARKEFLTIAATIDRRDFVRFALFDTFRRKRRWKNPLLFACIMSAFSIVCFAAQKTHEQAALLGTVLLSIGLVLPLVWYLLFLSSVKAEAKKHALSRTKAQYFTLLGQENIKVVRDKEEAVFSWTDLHAAFRVKGCIYLYVSLTRAYLLPECDDSDAAWNLITSHLPSEKTEDLR